MRITQLSEQKKNKDRMNLFLDGEFTCGILKETVMRYGLQIDMEITPEQLVQMRQQDEYSVALTKALDTVARSNKSRHELEKKLLDKGFDDACTQRVLERLEELHYIDDVMLAKQIMASALAKGEGMYRVRQKMMQKGIPEDTVHMVLAEMDEEQELGAAEQAAKGYIKRYADLPPLKARSMVSAALARRGFSYDIISQVVELTDED